jgi:hypothetical protein
LSGRLKGSASFGTTVPTGPYRNVKIAFEQEFWLDETTHEDVLAALAAKVDEAIAKLRSAPERIPD